MTIPATHVGSLPRGDELVPLLLARDHGKPFCMAEFDRKVQLAVDDAVARQVEAGVSVVSDGELGKVGYSTYVAERLCGRIIQTTKPTWPTCAVAARGRCDRSRAAAVAGLPWR
jgi:methionine synthase II (cobalamin-independent)